MSAKAHLSPVWLRIFELEVAHGEGVYLYATDGRRYLDFTSGIGVTNTGHCHPKVVAAIQEQAARLLHGQINIVIHRPVLELVEELLTIVPAPLDTFFFANSGAEAVEAAVKLARYATGRPNIIVFQGSFHGRTHMAMALTTSKTIYRAGYQPLPAGVYVAPYPYAYRYGWDEETTLRFCLRELDLLLKSQTAPEETAAILVEPILGEGGYVVPPRGFLTALRERCDHYGILLIADEVQTGFGRTGRFFAVEHEGVAPDILIMAKGIASGLPLSGIAARADLMARWKPGAHGGTFGANAVACAAAVATIRVMKEEKLPENAAARGTELLEGLRRLAPRFPAIGDVRGRGLMVGVEFTRNGEPDTALAKAVQAACFRRGLLLLTCGTYDNVIRWIPPLIVTAGQIQEGLHIFEEALGEAMEAAV
ncbi:aspartate aminotransferase family protein [Thermoflexus sp.]|uniref:aspartate aminotransferase family protein n=1 Tax=Thermoflexus sp. TaxID=1969742 RepID=UPI00175A0B62|nr:aminotransferase class III-fold pyridoxal phosphate-dependent enzyme [Thermoflexus sp.]